MTKDLSIYAESRCEAEGCWELARIGGLCWDHTPYPDGDETAIEIVIVDPPHWDEIEAEELPFD